MFILKKLGLEHTSKMSVLYGDCFPDTWEASFFEEKLKTSCVAYGAFNSLDLVGFIFAQIVEDESEILTFCIDNNYRKQGLGRKLLLFFLQQSKILNCFLEVKSDNKAAISLYERAGFKRKTIRTEYYNNIQSGRKDAIIYHYSKK